MAKSGLFLGVALLCMLNLASALTEGLVEYFDEECNEKLEKLYDTFYAAPNGTACRNNIQAALTEEDPAKCPNTNATLACFNVSKEHRTQWLAFTVKCELFYYPGLNSEHDVPPGEAVGSSEAEGRRRLLSGEATAAEGEATAAEGEAVDLSETSGAKVKTGCFPTLTKPRDFYLFLEGRLDASASTAASETSAAGFGSRMAMSAAALASAAVLMMAV